MSFADTGAPLKIMVVGLGGFGRSWATLAHAADGVVLKGAVDPVPAAREWACRELGGEVPTFPSLAEALLSVACDAVLVITPPPTHHAIATETLQAGKHVLVEKPLATTQAEAEELIRLAASAGRTLMVSQNYRFRPPLRAVQRFIASGALGELMAVDALFRRHTQTLFGDGNFRYQMEHPLILDMAIHHFDLVRAMTGRNVVKVDARSWRAPGTWYQHDPAMTALMELDGGVPFTYKGDWAPPSVVPDTSWNGEWTIRGERGTLIWRGGVDDALRGDVVFEPNTGTPIAIEQPELVASDRAGVLLAFRDALRTETEPETTARDNINSLAVVLATISSIEQREPITIARMPDHVAHEA